MTKKKLQERKEKKRKEKAKATVEARRKKLQEMRKEANETAKFQKHFGLKVAPYRRAADPALLEPEPAMTKQTKVDDPRKVEYIKKKLEHNMEILKALEEEFQREQEEREKNQKALEAEGAFTMREKLDLIAKKTEDRIATGDLSSSEELTSMPYDEHFFDGAVEAYMEPYSPQNDD